MSSLAPKQNYFNIYFANTLQKSLCIFEEAVKPTAMPGLMAYIPRKRLTIFTNGSSNLEGQLSLPDVFSSQKVLFDRTVA